MDDLPEAIQFFNEQAAAVIGGGDGDAAGVGVGDEVAVGIVGVCMTVALCIDGGGQVAGCIIRVGW